MAFAETVNPAIYLSLFLSREMRPKGQLRLRESVDPMSEQLILTLDGSAMEFHVRRVLVAGYTGRDASQVRAHIEELERQGIPAPESFPAVYPIDSSWTTTESELVVARPRVSGEAEPALLFRGDGVDDLDDALVSVIVDFTDREEERRSIPRSKLLPKPLSQRVWRYCDVKELWDEIALRSWVDPGPNGQFYQSGTLAQLLPPLDLLARLGLTDGLEGTVLLMGTLPLCTNEFSFSEYFSCELETPEHSKLTYECRIRRS